MAQYTVIPQIVQVDDETIFLNTNNKIQTTGKNNFLYGRQPDLIKLQLLKNTVANALTSVTDDLADIFSDSTGLNNTVIVNSTTSAYDVTNDVFSNDSYVDDEDFSTTSGTFVLAKTINPNMALDSIDVSFQSNDSYNQCQCKAKFIYDDTTQYETTISNTESVLKTQNWVPNSTTKIISSIEIYLLMTGSGYTAYLRKVELNKSGSNFNTDISVTYAKEKPQNIFIAVYDKDLTEITENVSCELIDTVSSESSGEFDVFTITAITMTATPNKLIIHQKNTGNTNIGYYVANIEV